MKQFESMYLIHSQNGGFHYFSISQILREIIFWDSGSAKSAILRLLEAKNFDFCGFLHFLKAEIDYIMQIQSP